MIAAVLGSTDGQRRRLELAASAKPPRKARSRRATLVSGTLSLLLLLSGCAGLDVEPRLLSEVDGASSRREAADLEQAHAAYDRGQFEMARRLFAEVAAREPTNWGAAIGLGEALLALGEEEAAAAQFTRAAEGSQARAQVARAYSGLGRVHLRKGEYDKARSLLERSTTRNPSDWRTWTALGQVYDRQKDFSAAHAAYAQAQEVGAGQAVVLNDVGMSLLSEGRESEALAYFQRALAADPSLPQARQNIRLTHARDRKYSDAIAGIEEVEQPVVLNNVGYIAILNGDYDVAASLLDEAIRVSPQYNATAIANLKLLQNVRTAGEG